MHVILLVFLCDYFLILLLYCTSLFFNIRETILIVLPCENKAIIDFTKTYKKSEESLQIIEKLSFSRSVTFGTKIFYSEWYLEWVIYCNKNLWITKFKGLLLVTFWQDNLLFIYKYWFGKLAYYTTNTTRKMATSFMITIVSMATFCCLSGKTYIMVIYILIII